MGTKHRIGKDLLVRWAFQNPEGGGFDLTGLDLRIELLDFFQRRTEVTDYIIEDNNKVVFTFAGTAQKVTGPYTLQAWVNKDKEGQSVVDACHCFELVPCTHMESDMGAEGPGTDYTDLVSTIQVGVQGKSAYASWISAGHAGTEEDFVAWLQEPARSAAEKALQTEKMVSDAEKLRVAAEDARKQAEQTRATTEGERIEAEKLRMTEEQKRTEAESGRVKAETLRVTEEQKRVAAESARATEFERLSGEMTTATSNAAEATRLAGEATTAANTATDEAKKATTASVTATGEAKEATKLANAATESAGNAATQAGNAATEAGNAAGRAEGAASVATEAARKANTAAGTASQQAQMATSAASAANTAAGRVEDVITEAGKATTAATNAASTANTAAGKADTAAGNASKAATAANDAASKANTASSEATEAATKADTAATNMMKYVTEYNVSALYPTSGIGGTNKYDLLTAIKVLDADPTVQKTVGIKCSFIGEDGNPQTYVFQGDVFNDTTNWKEFNSNEDDWKLIYRGHPLQKIAKRFTVKEVDYNNDTITFNEDISGLKIGSRIIPVYLDVTQGPDVMPAGFRPGFKVKEILSTSQIKVEGFHGGDVGGIRNDKPQKVDLTKICFDENAIIDIKIPSKYATGYDIKRVISSKSFAYIIYSPLSSTSVNCAGNQVGPTFGFIHYADFVVRESPDTNDAYYIASCVNVSGSSFVPTNYTRFVRKNSAYVFTRITLNCWERDTSLEIYVRKSSYETV